MGREGIVIFMMLTIIAGVALMIAAMTNRRKVREMEHRERLAMIERGLMPSPESDPGGFEATAGLHSVSQAALATGYRTAGVLMIGFGFALVLLITATTRKPEIGFGIGGGWAILGAASLVNYILITRREQHRPGSVGWSPPARRPDPPADIAP
jgi:hypothetical protein